MWLDSPQTLRQQILADFAAHRTPSGCVKARQRSKTVSHTNGHKSPGEDEPTDPRTKLAIS